MLKGEIIAVGTELLLGQIANTNAQYISQKLARIGVPLYYHVAVGDNVDRLKEAISTAVKRSNLIIFTGGLGPTQDDLTKEAVAEYLNKRLILNQQAYQRIVDFFANRKLPMTENNQKQAMVIEGSDVFQNNYGLAAGIGLEDRGVYFLFLPGPPSEMKPMLDHDVIPWIQEKYEGNTFYSKVMRFSGIGEAALEEKLMDLIKNQTNPTIAPLASDGEVTIRLTANGKDEAEAYSFIKPIEEIIHSRLQKYHYGYGDKQIEFVVYQLLKELKLTISISESCTGGLVGSKFTEIPGSSAVYSGGVICYDNKVKTKVLRVPTHIIESKGSVSMEVAQILSENTLTLFNTDIAISITGVAGPDSIENKPVGLIYIGISENGKETIVKELNLSGNRNAIQRRAAKYVLYYLWERLHERL